MKQTILITGAAGYIGSHALLEILQNTDYQVIAVDSLERGYIEAVQRVESLSGRKCMFEQGDLKDTTFVDHVMTTYKPQTIIHFAAYKSVSEGEQFPEKYHENNVIATENVLKAMVKHNCQKIVFSSSAAVYAVDQALPHTEESKLGPINIYGQTKLEMEQLIERYCKQYGLRAFAFRYFNAVGADVSGEIGEDPENSTNLLPLVLQTLVGNREKVSLFGNSFSTADGTQERDYIHVTDLAVAHLKAVQTELQPGVYIALNLSTGIPTSCKTLFELAEKVSGKHLKYEVTPPRKGDPERLFASNDRAKELLNWNPTRTIEISIKDQWNWVQKNPNGYK
jgi:UDP-glucose 4-epimerase